VVPSTPTVAPMRQRWSVIWDVRDWVLCAVITAVMLVEVVTWSGRDLSTAIPFGLMMTVPLAARRWQPIPAYVISLLGVEGLIRTMPLHDGFGFDNDSATLSVTYFVMIFSLGAHTRGREVWVSSLLIVLTMVSFYVDEAEGFDGGDLLFVAFFVGGPWAAGLALRLRSELAASHRLLQEQQEENTRRAIAEERATIARELHDVVAHAISVTVLQSRGARRQLGRDEEQVRRALDAIEHTNTQALGDMRRLLAVLRDTEGDAATTPQPSLARLDDLVADVRESGLDVDLVEVGADRDVPPGVDLSAYRIVQEALTNVLKHASAGSATVRLEYGDDELRLSVRDDGVGAPAESNGTGHGLVGIRERVAVVGGEIETGPADDGGFEVRARLPYSLEDA
jgi:signal transduction histidine kinase